MERGLTLHTELTLGYDKKNKPTKCFFQHNVLPET